MQQIHAAGRSPVPDHGPALRPRAPGRVRLGCSAALASIGAVTACAAGQYYQGDAYAASDHRLLYRESHWLYTESGVEHRLVVYACPSGEAFVRKRIATAPGAATPDDLFDARLGVRWFRLSLASWYGFALPHIDVAYDVQTHELREYSGLSNIRDGDGRNLNVAIRFPPSARRTGVAAAEVERAAAMPLTGRCLFR